MQLSKLGKIAHQCLIDIPEHFSHTELDAYVVMPNHIHAIIIIQNPSVEKQQDKKSSDLPVETQHVASLQKKWVRKFGPMKSGSLSKIVQAYKAAVTHHAHVTGFPDFAWQERFYDHIIRDEKSLENIRTYIAGNPAKWLKDKYYPG